jgi:hypothetical protein
LVAAVGEIDRCSPAECRARVSTRFSADAMVRAYEHLYESVTSPRVTRRRSRGWDGARGGTRRTTGR